MSGGARRCSTSRSPEARSSVPADAARPAPRAGATTIESVHCWQARGPTQPKAPRVPDRREPVRAAPTGRAPRRLRESRAVHLACRAVPAMNRLQHSASLCRQRRRARRLRRQRHAAARRRHRPATAAAAAAARTLIPTVHIAPAIGWRGGRQAGRRARPGRHGLRDRPRPPALAERCCRTATSSSPRPTRRPSRRTARACAAGS